MQHNDARGNDLVDIAKIDKNFKINTTIGREGLVFFDAQEHPFKIYGLIHEGGRFRRMPEAVAKTVNPGVAKLHECTTGGRVRFTTDSPYIAIAADMCDMPKTPHFALTGTIGFDLFTGKRYLGTYKPPFDITDGRFESVIDIPKDVGRVQEREYTINFPLYSSVLKLYIGLKEGSTLNPASPYSIEKPIVYYGSSITQGCCASRPGNTYQSIVSRNLDFNFINLGFSGSAKGEETVAHYIAGLDMTAFVYDYDHNAPTVEHLRDTHERMFLTIRKTHPTLPILMLSRPKYYLNDEEKGRLAIVRQTYQSALARGDKNVYMIEGPDLLLDCVRETALVDNCHPNDSGFVSMACVIEKELRRILL